MFRTFFAIFQGRETWKDLGERLWGPNVEGPRVWVHAASVGELKAVKSAIDHIALRHHVLVTTTTSTGRSTVMSWSNPKIASGLAPLDLSWITKLFLVKNDVTALIIVENELWPARILACHAGGTPVIMLNARMSDGTMKTWSRFPATAKQMFSQMAVILPQDGASTDRFALLGADKSQLLEPFNLKALYLPSHRPLPGNLASLDRSKTILAAATHEGEEKTVLKAFQKLKAKDTKLRLIIAPRHPERGQSIASLSKSGGFSVAQRSTNKNVVEDVYVADTIGEMDIWYRISGAAFIGGSLVDRGGHTPYEPAAYGCPIIHGPHISNFTEAYADVASQFPVWPIHSDNELARAFSAALSRTPEPYRSLQSAEHIFNALDHHLAERPQRQDV